VDITKIPQYAGMSAGEKSTIRQWISAFNSGFAADLNEAMASRPGLKIYMPDMFALLDNMVAHPGDYGLVNATGGVYATQGGYSTWNGSRNNWLFWDPWDPTAMAHAIMADVAQQLASPAHISKVTWLNGSNRLDVANIPVGRNGSVEGRTNLVLGSWTVVTNFNSTSAAQAIFVPASGPRWFYRLRFPSFAWSWP